MNTRSTRGLAALLAALFILPVLFSGQAAAQSTSDEVLQRLRAAYGSLEALRADFVQTAGSATIQGTIVLSGDRYRIEMPGQVLVTDGSTAWAYSSDDNQVLVNDHTADAQAFTPSTFFTQYPERFRVEVTGSENLGGVRHDVLQLTPRQADPYVRDVVLYVRSSDSLPTRVHLVDNGGATMSFELRNIERNPRIATDTFTFRAPAGAEVVDLR
jgi:outer membrane lipoprotein carrier protein